jgi:hypothetical protein
MQVYVRCQSGGNQIIAPENSTGTWPHPVTVLENQSSAQFNIYAQDVPLGSYDVLFACDDGTNSNCSILHQKTETVVVDDLSEDAFVPGKIIQGIGRPVPISIMAGLDTVNYFIVGGIESFDCTVSVYSLFPGNNFVLVDVTDRDLLNPPMDADNPTGLWPYILRFDQTKSRTFRITSNKPEQTTNVQVMAYQYQANPLDPHKVINLPKELPVRVPTSQTL